MRRSALKDSRVRLECALLTHCYALQTHFSTARVSIFLEHSPPVRMYHLNVSVSLDYITFDWLDWLRGAALLYLPLCGV